MTDLSKFNGLSSVDCATILCNATRLKLLKVHQQGLMKTKLTVDESLAEVQKELLELESEKINGISWKEYAFD